MAKVASLVARAVCHKSTASDVGTPSQANRQILVDPLKKSAFLAINDKPKSVSQIRENASGLVRQDRDCFSRKTHSLGGK